MVGGLLPWLALPLSQALATSHSHALLVQGPAGVGQFDLALALAQAWLCEAPQTDSPRQGWACLSCASCKLFSSRTHPDFQLLLPEALLLDRFRSAGIASSPYAYALDPSGETVLGLIEADPFRDVAPPPILPDGEWISLQTICQDS